MNLDAPRPGRPAPTARACSPVPMALPGRYLEHLRGHEVDLCVVRGLHAAGSATSPRMVSFVAMPDLKVLPRFARRPRLSAEGSRNVSWSAWPQPPTPNPSPGSGPAPYPGSRSASRSCIWFGASTSLLALHVSKPQAHLPGMLIRQHLVGLGRVREADGGGGAHTPLCTLGWPPGQ